MNYNRYEDWKEDAERMGLSIENGGDNKMIAHDDGDEKGWWDPNYCAGFGELETK